MGNQQPQACVLGIRMRQTNSQAELVARRGELMAELLLQDLEPASLARPPNDFGYDFLVRFINRRGGTNIIGVEVKATERLGTSLFAIDRRTYDLLAHSSIPAFQDFSS